MNRLTCKPYSRKPVLELTNKAVLHLTNEISCASGKGNGDIVFASALPGAPPDMYLLEGIGRTCIIDFTVLGVSRNDVINEQERAQEIDMMVNFQF